jgi:RhtB (resistance to homoserine/threonine) family protein
MLELVSVITITLLAVISPGADFAMVSRNSMFLSRRAGLLTALGISLGVLVHVSYSMLGIGLLISQSIVLFNLVKFAGAAYLIWLGIGMLRSRKADPAAMAVQAPQLSDWQALRVGFLTNALNPKTTLFVVALFSQVISPDTAVLTQLGYGLFMAVAHLGWFALVAYGLSSEAARGFVTRARHLIERAIGGVLVALGLGLALSSVQRT